MAEQDSQYSRWGEFCVGSGAGLAVRVTGTVLSQLCFGSPSGMTGLAPAAKWTTAGKTKENPAVPERPHVVEVGRGPRDIPKGGCPVLPV